MLGDELDGSLELGREVVIGGAELAGVLAGDDAGRELVVVGLGDAAVKESRERIRTAISNSALPWPRTKIMVSLSPAHLPKAGSHFDLPVAPDQHTS